jgi:hypothetical protein
MIMENSPKWELSNIVRNRITKSNKNWLGIVCGGTGSGKTYSAMRLCENIDPTFNIDRIVFSIGDFLKLINSGKLQKGQAIIFDEAGVGMDAKTWYSISNRLMGYLIQTFRYLNLAVVFTTPSIKYIDKGIRGLFHARIETKGINKRKQTVKTKIYFLKLNFDGDTIHYLPRIRAPGTKRIIVIDHYNFSLPSSKLIDEYEAKHRIWKDALGKDIGKEVEGLSKMSGSGRATKISPAISAYIMSLLARHIHQKDIVQKVKTKYGMEISQQSVSWVKFNFQKRY